MLLPALMSLVVAQPQLALPWPCEQTYRCTQGHNGGSHTGLGAWAWDFGLAEGHAVHAAAAGTVRRLRMDSTQGGCDRAYANDANYVVIDHGDGTSALYLHLQTNSSVLQVGDLVAAGDFIARVGLTGWVCGAHLHFQVQENCSSWWCASMPATFQGHGDPANGASLVDSCAQCEAVLSFEAPTLISESDGACFQRQTEWWWSVDEGHDGHHYYTFAVDSPSNETVGQWHFGVAESGEYAVEAFVPTTEATSQNASYSVHHAGGVAQRAINQDRQKGWQSLGHYHFESDVAGSIVLGDATGEDYNTLMRKVAFDAVRLSEYVPAPQPDAGPAVDSGAPLPPLDSGAMAPREDAGGLDAEAPEPADAGVDAGLSVATDASVRPGTGTDAGCVCVRPVTVPATSWGYVAVCLALIIRITRRSRALARNSASRRSDM